MHRWLGAARLAAVAAVVVGLALAYHAGVFQELSEPRRFAERLVGLGGWGYAGFVLTYAVLQPFGVPGTVFVVAAPLIWPWRTAFALSMVGTMAASVIGFSFARFVARDWVAARIPARLRRYDAALERDALRTVFFLRLIFWMPQVLHGFLGVSKVPFWTHFWGSLAGYVPPLLLVSYLGSELFDPSGRLRSDAWPALGALLAGSLLLLALTRLRGGRRRGASDDDLSAAPREPLA